jgi:antitoxin PrlF
MPASTLTSKGQITIPKDVRKALRLEVGDRVLFRVRDDSVVELTAETIDLLSLCGILKPRKRGVTLADMEEAIGDAAAEL